MSTAKQETDSTNQRITGTLVQREVVHNCSYMIDHLYKDESLQDELYCIMSQDDYKSACEEEDYLILDDENGDSYIIEDNTEDIALLECLSSDNSDTLDGYFLSINDSEDYQEIAELLNIQPHLKEALEYWIVTSWLADKLEEQGEMVTEVLGFHVWGRTCSGQLISMDSVIFDIANDMEILKGQRNSWE